MMRSKANANQHWSNGGQAKSDAGFRIYRDERGKEGEHEPMTVFMNKIELLWRSRG
jgi:hypothetical protein